MTKRCFEASEVLMFLEPRVIEEDVFHVVLIFFIQGTSMATLHIDSL